ncbi:hypothetical protein [Ruania rhizosphaerae]|uniref:hypothetical protein n=1 Tax=Ruania rhizosphaerae TaxID=1840413 RepID=UPI00135AB57D|nr:hypothetical protein [Ruania rhizosphaerae]
MAMAVAVWRHRWTDLYSDKRIRLGYALLHDAYFKLGSVVSLLAPSWMRATDLLVAGRLNQFRHHAVLAASRTNGIVINEAEGQQPDSPDRS